MHPTVKSASGMKLSFAAYQEILDKSPGNFLIVHGCIILYHRRIEIKYSDERPDWAVAILASLSEPTSGERPSKFVVGVRHLRRHLHPYAGQ